MMPWGPSDVDRFRGGLSQDQKVKWARVANAVLEKENDEELAIRVANSKVGPSTKTSI